MSRKHRNNGPTFGSTVLDFREARKCQSHRVKPPFRLVSQVARHFEKHDYHPYDTWEQLLNRAKRCMIAAHHRGLELHGEEWMQKTIRMVDDGRKRTARERIERDIFREAVIRTQLDNFDPRKL